MEQAGSEADSEDSRFKGRISDWGRIEIGIFTLSLWLIAIIIPSQQLDMKPHHILPEVKWDFPESRDAKNNAWLRWCTKDIEES